jgi:preprotein translocase subunit SecE
VMVFIMVAITSVFFLLVDGSLSFLMQQLLQFAK